MHKPFLITYDLVYPERDNEGLIETIKSFPQWGRITQNSWIVVSELSALDIRKKLQTKINDDDRLFVLQTGAEAAWHNLKSPNDWLKNSLAKV